MSTKAIDRVGEADAVQPSSATALRSRHLLGIAGLDAAEREAVVAYLLQLDDNVGDDPLGWPTLYESPRALDLTDPAHDRGPAPGAPHELTPSPGPELYYALDDGRGYPPRILLTKQGERLSVHY